MLAHAPLVAVEFQHLMGGAAAATKNIADTRRVQGRSTKPPCRNGVADADVEGAA